MINLEPRVILAPYLRYGRQIMTSERIEFLSQKLWDSGLNCACQNFFSYCFRLTSARTQIRAHGPLRHQKQCFETLIKTPISSPLTYVHNFPNLSLIYLTMRKCQTSFFWYCFGIFLFNKSSFDPLRCALLLFQVRIKLLTTILHRYRRGHRFKSRTGLNFFQVLFSLLPK